MGWEYSMEQILPGGIIGTFSKGNYCGYFYEGGRTAIHKKTYKHPHTWISQNLIFKGKIKNKSELKVLLKQLGI